MTETVSLLITMNQTYFAGVLRLQQCGTPGSQTAWIQWWQSVCLVVPGCTQLSDAPVHEWRGSTYILPVYVNYNLNK